MRTIMRRTLVSLLTAASLLATASLAHAAGGIAMRWDRCYGDGGVANKLFACDTNTGVERLVVSFVPDVDVPDLNGIEVGVEVASSTASLPAWWQYFTAGSCRSTAASVSVTPPAGSVQCTDPSAGNWAGGLGAYSPNTGSGAFYGNNAAVFQIALALPQPLTAPVQAGHEYHAVTIVITHARSVGTGACSGCVTPMCLAASYVTLTTSGSGGTVQTLSHPFAGNSSAVSWQGGSPELTFVPQGSRPSARPYAYISGCGLPTPARNQTWGAIKSLYR
jgi:hypothetical protein